jgi:HD-GYP domain-containing protein (c-di-GMP phosphodiesterase class II)
VALSESYQRLEESSLEAIETPNATVEAKDPYTAGHSLRVQTISLSIGRELGLTIKELDALRYGGLFHDIGKIAIPDALLTKPGRLTNEEYESCPHRGEVQPPPRFRLDHSSPPRALGRPGLPGWSGGRRHPAGRGHRGSGRRWDAMTSERPYQRALSSEEALEEVRACRGTQFAPAVVDAFFEAVRKRPEDFGIAQPLAAPVAS